MKELDRLYEEHKQVVELVRKGHPELLNKMHSLQTKMLSLSMRGAHANRPRTN